jgi:hypothetical protein
MGGQHHVPAALPPGKTRYPLYRRLGRPQFRSEHVRKISPPPGFDPRTVQPVVNRYTDWATQPTKHVSRVQNVATIAWLRHLEQIMSLPMINVLYFHIITLGNYYFFHVLPTVHLDNLCKENQLYALLIFNLFRQSTSTRFQDMLPIIRRYTLCIYSNWYLLYIRLTGCCSGQDGTGLILTRPAAS